MAQQKKKENAKRTNDLGGSFAVYRIRLLAAQIEHNNKSKMKITCKQANG